MIQNLNNSSFFLFIVSYQNQVWFNSSILGHMHLENSGIMARFLKVMINDLLDGASPDRSLSLRHGWKGHMTHTTVNGFKHHHVSKIAHVF